MGKRLISIVTACFNEEENVDECYRQIKAVMETFRDRYDYEQIFIDNASTDRTVERVKAIIARDRNVRLIVNARNFGQVRSPFYGLLQARGDAVVSMASDLQDPPELLRDFIGKWEEGYKNVLGVKAKSEESPLMFVLRRTFYHLMARISDTDQVKGFTGFGLYDKSFIDLLRQLDDPYPYLRGLIPEFGFSRAEVRYTQPRRQRGKTSNNFFTLYDMAMLGFVNHSKLPLRLSSFIGFNVAALSVVIALVYLVYKLLFWDSFQLGIAPLVIGIFFLGGLQLFFLGVIGEYIGATFTQVRKRPLVIERERVNFPAASAAEDL